MDTLTTRHDWAFFRASYCCVLVAQIIRDLPTYLRAASVAPEHNPVPLHQVLEIGRPTPAMIAVLAGTLVIGLVLTGFGVRTRVAAASSAVAYFLMVGGVLGFFKSAHSPYVWHSQNIVFFVLVLVAAFPGDCLRILWKPSSVARPGAVDDPAWGTKLVIATLGLAYFGSGYVKVVTSGVLWADGFTLQYAVLEKAILDGTTRGMWLANHHELCVVLGATTLLLELTFIVGIWVARLRPFYVAGGFLLHVGILSVLGIDFLKYFCFTYLIFFRWAYIRWLLERAQAFADKW